MINALGSHAIRCRHGLVEFVEVFNAVFTVKELAKVPEKSEHILCIGHILCTEHILHIEHILQIENILHIERILCIFTVKELAEVLKSQRSHTFSRKILKGKKIYK
jgi:hypothetical protein